MSPPPSPTGAPAPAAASASAAGPAPRTSARNGVAVILVSLLALLGGAWLFGLARFLRADGGISVTLPRQGEPPAEEHNLASWRWGPTVRVSSYHRDPFAHHHPAFLVDERLGPSPLEKWASEPRDRHPWIEITWREPHDLSRVVLRHAGEVEGDALTLERYKVTCLRDSGTGVAPAPEIAVVINDNQLRVAIHPLPCARARGVRVQVEPRAADTMARLYEIEAWGR